MDTQFRGAKPLVSLRGVARSALLMVAMVVSASHAWAAKPLMSEPTGDLISGLPQPSVGQEVVRSKPVLVDTTVFADPEASAGATGDVSDSVHFTMDLFETGKPTAMVRPSRVTLDGVQSWVGKLLDDTDSTVVAALNGEVLQANIRSEKYGYFQIRFLQDANGVAVHALREIDEAGFPDMHPPGFEDGGMVDNGDTGVNAQPAAQRDSAAGDDGSNLDVMIVYTPAARAAVGGTTAMETLIALAATETNDSYTNSGVTPTMTVVATSEVSYTESGSFSTDLNRLVGQSDGYMDNVHALRDTYNADMVGLLNNSTAYCGLASSIMATEANAFQVTYHGCATGYYSFAHEFGHLQGARHDWRVDSTNNSPHTHNHGYVHRAGSWRTIMAYNDPACSGGSCTRIKYWSNPNVNYGGVAMGAPLSSAQPADNRLTLNKTAMTVANFRQASTATAPSLSAPTPGSTLGGAGETFSWTSNGSTVQNWWLYAGSSVGAHDYFDSGNLSAGTMSYSGSGLPTDGSTVHITLWYRIAGSWDKSHYTFTASTVAMPELLSPAAGSTLSPSAAFVWTANGVDVEGWWIYLGSTAESRDIYDSGALAAGEGSHFVSGMESSTSKVHLTLWYKVSGAWLKRGFEFDAPTTGGDFDDQFTSGIDDWTAASGTWTHASGNWAYAPDSNATGRAILLRTEGEYTDLDYRVRIWRDGTATNANALYVRSSGTHDSSGCSDCYQFQISANGNYSIYERTSGSASALQAWTNAPLGLITSGWNELRVIMIGEQYWFLVNGVLLSTGTDNTHSKGRVGIAPYKSVAMMFWADFATLDIPTADADMSGFHLSPAQAAANAAANAMPALSDPDQAPQ